MAASNLAGLLSLRSDLSTGVGLARLIGDMAKRGGPYDSRPDSPNYAAHHETLPLQPGEQVTQAYPAVVSSGRSSVPAVVRQTDQSRVYVDPYRFPPAPGIVGSLASRQLRREGLQQPMAFEARQIQQQEPSPDRIEITAPNVQIRAFPDAPMGKVTDLSPAQQIRHAMRLVRGR